jgi:hypothetical protein
MPPNGYGHDDEIGAGQRCALIGGAAFRQLGRFALNQALSQRVHDLQAPRIDVHQSNRAAAQRLRLDEKAHQMGTKVLLPPPTMVIFLPTDFSDHRFWPENGP